MLSQVLITCHQPSKNRNLMLDSLKQNMSFSTLFQVQNPVQLLDIQSHTAWAGMYQMWKKWSSHWKSGSQIVQKRFDLLMTFKVDLLIISSILFLELFESPTYNLRSGDRKLPHLQPEPPPIE